LVRNPQTLVMGDKSEAKFDYSILPAADAEWLRQTAASLSLSFRKSVAEMLAAGLNLEKAKRRLGHGYWRRWLEENQFHHRSASRFIAVAKVFGKVEPAVMERFNPTALYELSDKGVPQSLREFAVEQAQDGATITQMLVMEWLVAYWENPAAPLRLAQKEERIVDIDPDEVFGVDNWRLLEELAKTGTVHFASSTDEDPQIDDQWIIGVYIKRATETEPAIRRTATHSTLERVLLSLCQTVRKKACAKCKEVKPLDEFSRRKDKPDGRNMYCLNCERVRVREYERNKRAKAKALAMQQVA